MIRRQCKYRAEHLTINILPIQHRDHRFNKAKESAESICLHLTKQHAAVARAYPYLLKLREVFAAYRRKQGQIPQIIGRLGHKLRGFCGDEIDFAAVLILEIIFLRNRGSSSKSQAHGAVIQKDAHLRSGCIETEAVRFRLGYLHVGVDMGKAVDKAYELLLGIQSGIVPVGNDAHRRIQKGGSSAAVAEYQRLHIAGVYLHGLLLRLRLTLFGIGQPVRNNCGYSH